MRWQLKLVKNYIFALLPFPTTVRSIKRKFFPYPTTIDEWTLEQGLRQIEMLRAAGYAVEGKIVLELGTGWKPLIPLLFMLAGARRVVLIDSQRLLDLRLVRGIARELSAYKDMLAARLGTSPATIAGKLEFDESFSLDELFKKFGLVYLAPYDARTSELGDQTIDIVTSRAVLEHVPPEILRSLFMEFHRVLKDGGAMCHVIDNSDHWEHGDKRISKLHFLKYPESIWRVFTINKLDYQNRLRHFEYLGLLKDYGFDLALDWSKPDHEAMQSLETLTLCKRYSNVPFEDLAVLTSYIVATKNVGRVGDSPARSTRFESSNR